MLPTPAWHISGPPSTSADMSPINSFFKRASVSLALPVSTYQCRAFPHGLPSPVMSHPFPSWPLHPQSPKYLLSSPASPPAPQPGCEGAFRALYCPSLKHTSGPSPSLHLCFSSGSSAFPSPPLFHLQGSTHQCPKASSECLSHLKP